MSLTMVHVPKERLEGTKYGETVRFLVGRAVFVLDAHRDPAAFIVIDDVRLVLMRESHDKYTLSTNSFEALVIYIGSGFNLIFEEKSPTTDKRVLLCQ